MKDEKQDKQLREQGKQIEDNLTSIQLIDQKLGFISEQIRDIKTLLTQGYVTKVEYQGFCKATEKRVSDMEGIISKVTWLIVTPLIGGAVIAAAIIISQNL